MASFTAIDANHANRSLEAREILHRLCVAANLCPQIMSHVVLEIHAANPRVDYRFNREFADHAIRVVLRWHDSGRGCINSSCYPTYPKGKVCNVTTPPTVFMSGDTETIQACQPACFVRQRLNRLLKSAVSIGDKTSLITDNSDPKKCVECTYYTPLLTDTIVRRKLDNTYDLWDAKSRTQLPAKPLPAGFHLQEAVTDEVGGPKTDTDLVLLHWNRQEKRCERSSGELLRQIVEPYWRDATHAKCRLTNFTRGENVVPGYFSRDGVNMDDATKKLNIEGFLQKNTATYCRAFGREWKPDTGECVYAWWETALTYTILGEGVFRLVRNLTETDSGCVDDYWKPIDAELDPKHKDAAPFSARSFREWRGDVNLQFLLPPPNVTMLDLGIDVLVTGNRLYWNNFEGVLSHMAMFRTIESIVLRRNDAEEENRYSFNSNRNRNRNNNNNDDNDNSNGNNNSNGNGNANGNVEEYALDNWRDKYANYNDSGRDKNASGMFGSLSKENASFVYQPTASSVVTEKFLQLLNAMDAKANNSEGGGGGGGGGSGNGGGSAISGGTYTAEDVKKLIDEINELSSQNRIAEIFMELGIQLGADVARDVITSALKKSMKRLLQHLTRNLAGKVAGGVMRMGLRIGLSRVIGAAFSQLTTKLIIAGTAAATGVGIVISVVEILSLLVDVALMFGWDPGNYNSYTSAASFRPLMDAYMYSLYTDNVLSFTPDLLAAQITNSTTDSVDADKATSNGSGTADSRASETSTEAPEYTDTDSIDRRVNEPRWFNKKWTNCFATDAASLSIVSGNVFTHNGQAPVSGRTKLTSPRLALENSSDLWIQLYLFAYFGSLQTNSNGQLVRLEENTSEFNDDTLADLVQEADYRDLTTISSGRNIDNRSYNKRVLRYRLLSGIVLGLTGVTAVAVALVTAKETSRSSSFFFWGMSFVAVLSLIAVLVCSIGFHVFDDRYLQSTKALLTTAGQGGGSADPTTAAKATNELAKTNTDADIDVTGSGSADSFTVMPTDPDKPASNLLSTIDTSTRERSISRIIDKFTLFQQTIQII